MKEHSSGWRSGTLIAAAAAHVLAAAAIAQDAGAKEPLVRYALPAVMMVTWAEWPEDPKQQDVMAQFIKEHGFNAVEVEADLLDMCRRNGLYARLGHGDLDELLKQAATLKDDPTVFAYFISDRRRASSFPEFAQIAAAFEKADPNHPTIFINRANWNEFHDFAAQVNPMILDFYHYHWDGRRYPERRYIYLSSFRQLGQERGIPVMRCVGANYPLPQLRQTFYTSLAYGIRAFHFWPPWMFSYEKKDDKTVLKDGKIVPRVNLPPLAEVAKEVQPLGKELIKLRSVGVYHTKPIHPEAPGAAEFPKDYWIVPSGEQILLGMFEDAAGLDHVMAVNCDIAGERETTLSMPATVSQVERLDKGKGGAWRAMDLSGVGDRQAVTLKLAPGSGELLRVTRPATE